MQKPRVADKVLLSLVAGLLVLGGVSLALFPAPRYSETENRYLADFPAFDRTALTEGTLGASLDTYCAERLLLRGTLRGTRALYHLALGEHEVHGVIRAHDGSLIRRMTVNETAYTQNLTALARLAREAEAAGLPFTVAIAPRRIDVRADLLPALWSITREQSVWQRLDTTFPDAVTFLDATNDDYWFHTDHHWTADGAFFAYEQLGTALGYTPLSKAAFARVTASESFYGTSDAAAGIPHTAPDRLDLLTRADDADFRAVADGKPLPFTGFYDKSKLDTRDQYAVYLGGNYGVLKIEQGEGDTRPILLILKDSFANSMLPFLARHYRILAVDTRYYRGDLASLATTCDAALVLCGMQTLTESALFSRAHLQ